MFYAINSRLPNLEILLKTSLLQIHCKLMWPKCGINDHKHFEILFISHLLQTVIILIFESILKIKESLFKQII